MKKYEPYKFDSFQQLLKKAYGYGMYSGTQELLTVKMLGEFEGWSGRATETWEHRFVVTFFNPEIKIGITMSGKTLEETCSAILKGGLE